MSSELITLLMFSSMVLMLLTGQRVFGVIGFVGSAAALLLWGDGAVEMPFNAVFQVLNWYPLLTLPLFVYMGYMLSESGIANDLYRMFHVWTGPVRGGLALGTIGLMVAISAMNGLSVAGMAIGATVALPELLKRGYDKVMVTGVIQAGSSLGILLPPSVVLVLYAMIARQPVMQLWLAGIIPGLLMATIFAAYVYIRCRLQPHLGPPLPQEEREQITWGEKFRLLSAGILPVVIFGTMMGLFLSGITSLVESNDGNDVCRRVSLHRALPVITRMDRRVMRFGANGGRVENDIRSLQREDAGRLREPLVPADSRTHAAVPRVPHLKSRIAGAEVIFLAIARPVRDVRFAIGAEDLAAIDHHQRIVESVIRALIDRNRQYDAILLRNRAQMTHGRIFIHRQRKLQQVGRCVLAEIMCLKKLL